VKQKIGNIEFLTSSVSYPLLVHRFKNNDLLCEIIVREKQYAVGIMPMLYFCIALSSLKDSNNASFLGRKIKSNELGILEINKDNINIFIQMFRIFSVLSKANKHDCAEILRYLLHKAN